jgi:transcription elongation factor SPT6
MPERMQLRQVPVTKVGKDSPELEEEAEWIYKQAFCRPTISVQVKLLYTQSYTQ